MYNQFTNKAPLRLEKSSVKTLCTSVPVTPNSSRIVQCQLQGSMIEANRIGYDFTLDDELPKEFNFMNPYTMDLEDKMDFLRYMNHKVAEIQTTINDDNQKKAAEDAAIRKNELKAAVKALQSEETDKVDKKTE